MTMEWSELRESVLSCRRCRLGEGRISTVFGEGDTGSDVLFLGEAPGAEEDRSGRPFVGRSGRFLTELMEEAGIRREDVFISNSVRCRPPDNRAPRPDELKCCRPWLDDMLRRLSPKVIVTVGNVPSRAILETGEGISSLRGRFHGAVLACGPVAVRPIFHPAYLLRNRSRDPGKPLSLTLEDLKSLLPWCGTGDKNKEVDL